MRPFLLLALLLSTTATRAHELWIEPSRFAPAPGELVKLRLLVGQGLVGDAVPRNDAWIERFEVIEDGVASKVAGIDGGDPAGLLRLARKGAAIVVYGGTPTPIELDAARFEEYLEAEGLDGPKEARRREGSSGRPGRERFSRCAKAVLASGPAVTEPAGLDLEIVPEVDPGRLRAGEALPVRVLDHGRPLRGVLVKALDRGGAQVRARTDASGRATLTLPRAGLWLLNAVHMVPVRDDPRVDWESTWASLTFELPGTLSENDDLHRRPAHPARRARHLEGGGAAPARAPGEAPVIPAAR